MGWKDYSYTKRGGIIGAVVGSLSVLIYDLNFLIIYYTHTPRLYFPFLNPIKELIEIPMTPVNLIAYFLGWAMPYPIVVVAALIINAILYGIIGIFIGWIIGKIKNR